MTSPAKIKAVLGPTNTGKTHYAIERLLAHRSGMIGLPLRLLAREVYQTIAARVGAHAVALVTGEERIVPPQPRYWVATVEAMPLDIPVDCVAIDEIQTAIDFDRGHIFTNRILAARGRAETLLLGAATMTPLIRTLLPEAEIVYRPRLSTLMWAGSKKISRQPRRSAIVAFSASEVYAIAELLRRERGGAAVVMGALSPRTRNAQVELYQNRDVDFLVATDAIGMGLNLDVHHVAFAADMKFDGHQTRPLTPAEIGQIAGRAGRYKTDGTFGVTAGVDLFEDELIDRLQSHEFEPVRQVQWRNARLDFASLDALRKSLDLTPDRPGLTRAPNAIDQIALERLTRTELGALASSEAGVRTLWECCQIPDYRNISPGAHADIVARVFADLQQHGAISSDWIAQGVGFCDNMSGDIDTLSNRIRQIRTWTFIANRKNWLEDPSHWREKTRDIEDRLSDALHERLTQRFVDRRTSVLIRHLRDKAMQSPEINDTGEITLEGHLIGSLSGFRFTLARIEGEVDAKGLRTAAQSVVAPAIHAKADRLAGAPNEELVLATDGHVRWRGEVVGELAEGNDIFSPRVIVLADDTLNGVDLERVQDRLSLWLRHQINTVLEPVLALRAPADLEGSARGIAFQIAEHLGILPRHAVADDIKALDQDVRGKMRKLGIKFGAHHIYVPLSLKPAPRELALILHALKHGGLDQPGVSDLPQIVLSGRTSFETDPAIAVALYEVSGFKVAGKRAVRVDILERLADIIRPLIAFDPERAAPGADIPAGAAERNGFRVTVEMTSLLGCAGEDFASILKSLGYRVQRKPKPPALVVEAASEAAPQPSSADADAMAAIEGAVTHTPHEPAIAEGLEPAPTPAGDAEAQPAAQPAEPEMDEVWFPAGRRPDNPRHDNQRHGKPRHGARSGDGAAPADAPHEHKGKRGKPGGHKPGKPHRERNETDMAERKPRHEPERKRDKPIDPDSPFAALAALKLGRK